MGGAEGAGGGVVVSEWGRLWLWARQLAGVGLGVGGVGGRGGHGGDHIFLVEQEWRGGVGGGGGGQKKEGEAEVGELHFFRRVHHVAVGPEEKRCGVVDRDQNGEERTVRGRSRTNNLSGRVAHLPTQPVDFQVFI